MRLEGLGQLKNPVTSLGIRSRDLPACSIVSHPTTLPRAPHKACQIFIFHICVISMENSLCQNTGTVLKRRDSNYQFALIVCGG
jgi:hypothetical protein